MKSRGLTHSTTADTPAPPPLNERTAALDPLLEKMPGDLLISGSLGWQLKSDPAAHTPPQYRSEQMVLIA